MNVLLNRNGKYHQSQMVKGFKKRKNKRDLEAT